MLKGILGMIYFQKTLSLGDYRMKQEQNSRYFLRTFDLDKNQLDLRALKHSFSQNTGVKANVSNALFNGFDIQNTFTNLTVPIYTWEDTFTPLDDWFESQNRKYSDLDICTLRLADLSKLQTLIAPILDLEKQQAPIEQVEEKATSLLPVRNDEAYDKDYFDQLTDFDTSINVELLLVQELERSGLNQNDINLKYKYSPVASIF